MRNASLDAHADAAATCGARLRCSDSEVAMPGGGGKGGGGSSSTVNVNNGPISVDADSTVELKGLDNIKLTLAPTPLKTESRQELVVAQPFKTENKLDTTADITSDSKNAMSIDLQPVALDVCVKTASTLPQGQISQPFSFHLGFTWFGLEMFGVNFGGESRVVMQDLPKKPSIEWPAQQHGASGSHHTHARPASGGSAGGGSAPAGRERGLRVRIK
jgi:hypothetical protein